MSVFSSRMAELIFKFLNDELSGAEETELNEFIDKSPELKEVFDRTTDLDWLLLTVQEMYTIDEERAWQKILDKGTFRTGRITSWLKYLSAAVVLIAVTIIAYLYFNHKQKTIDKVVESDKRNIDSLIAANTGILETAGGTNILLDTARDGILSTPGNTQIEKKGHEIIYKPSTAKNAGIEKLSALRFGEYTVVLPDGSRVWLNSESAISFPSRFDENKKTVQLQGEAFFEVTRDSMRTFHVVMNNVSVEALGTRFNMNGYADEPVVKVTLLEGSVKVKGKNSDTTLKPGQQAILSPAGKIKQIASVDGKQVADWTKGNYQFYNEDLKTIMRQLERWYNVSVEYEGPIPNRKYSGMFSRTENAEVIIGRLTTMTGFKIVHHQGKITVSP